MDWSSLAPFLVRFGAPVLGAIIGGPAGAIVGKVGAVIANALGVEATPAAVNNAIAADPDGAAAKIAAAEDKYADELAAAAQVEIARLQEQSKQFASGVEDNANARAAAAALAATGSRLSYAAPVLGVVITIAFFTLLGLRLLHPVAVSDPLLDGLIGALATSFIQVVSYYFGSSQGSAYKDIAMQHISVAAVTQGAAQGGLPPAPVGFRAASNDNATARLRKPAARR